MLLDIIKNLFPSILHFGRTSKGSGRQKAFFGVKGSGRQKANGRQKAFLCNTFVSQKREKKWFKISSMNGSEMG